MFDPGPPLHDLPHQISVSGPPPPAGALRHALRCIAAFFGGVLVMNGAFRLVPFPSAGRAATAGITILIGLALLLPLARVGLLHVLRIHRYRADRCIHCAYPIRGLSGVTCPECGRDPFL